MARASPIQTNFNAGRLSARLEGRVDLAKYVNGCRQLQNFLPQIQGPAEKRPGTRYVADANVQNGQNSHVRLIPFEFSTDDAYILEFTHQTIRVYRNSGRVLAQSLAFLATDIDDTLDQIHNDLGLTRHFLAHTHGPYRISTTGTLPTGLSAGVDYFIVNNEERTLTFGQGDIDTGTDIITVTGTNDFVPANVDIATDTISISEHGYKDGFGPVQLTVDTTLPGGLFIDTDYFIIRLSDTDIQLALSRRGKPVDITTTGTGTFTIHDDHRYTAGFHDGPVRLTTTGTLPTGLALATDYWVNRSTPSELTLSATREGSAVNITDQGVGAHTMTPRNPNDPVRFQLSATRGGVSIAITQGTGTHLLTPESGLPVQVFSPYEGAQDPEDQPTHEIFEIQFSQSADVMFLAHESHAPMKLSRTGHDQWTLEQIDFDWAAFQPENLDTEVVVISTEETGTPSLLISTEGLFTEEMVGGFFKQRVQFAGRYANWIPGADPYGASKWLGETFQQGSRIQHEGNVYRMADDNQQTTTGTVAPIHTEGTHFDGMVYWQFLHSGAGYSKITGFRSKFRVDAEIRRRIPRDAVSEGQVVTAIVNGLDAEVTTQLNHGWETGDTVMLFDATGMPEVNEIAFQISVSGTGTFNLDGFDATLLGSYDANSARVYRTKSTALFGEDNSSTRLQSSLWSIGAFSELNGFPRTVNFYEDRLFWAGTIANPQTFWASVTGEFENHEITDLDESALIFTLNTDEVNAIEWISPGKVLAIGTAGGEFIANASTLEQPLTPNNIRVVRHANFGSRKGVMPQAIEQVVLFVQRAGGRIRELVFDFDTDSFVAPDLTVLSDDLFGKAVQTGSNDDKFQAPRSMAFQQEPKRNLWVGLDSGELNCLTYDRAQQVVGWHTHLIGNIGTWSVQSVGVIPHPDGDGDQLWLAVRTGTDPSSVIQIMFIEKPWHDQRDLEDAFYVDSGLTYDPDTPAAVTTLTGLDHLEGLTVQVLADGIRRDDQVVSGGSITIGEPAAFVVQVGLGYDAILQTMRIEAGSAEGSAQGKIKRISKFVVRVNQMGKGLKYGAEDDSELEDVPQDEAATADDLKDGDTDALPWPKGYEQEGRVLLKHSTPFPCTLTAIMPQTVVQDR